MPYMQWRQKDVDTLKVYQDRIPSGVMRHGKGKIIDGFWEGTLLIAYTKIGEHCDFGASPEVPCDSLRSEVHRFGNICTPEGAIRTDR